VQLPGWLRNRWRRWRNAKLLDPLVQRKLSGFWLTRRRARREAAETFDLVAGFVYSQVLLACHRLGVLTQLRDGPMPHSQLLSNLELPPAAGLTLLRAAAALDLLESDESNADEVTWWLGVKGAALLGNAGALAMIEHHAVLYRDLVDPVALLRAPRGSSELAQYWPYATADAPARAAPQQIGAYTTLMAASQGLVADEILDAYDFSRHRRILDIGGGDGTFLRHVRERAPQAQLVLFDLPAVAAEAGRRFAAASGVECVGGDFARDALPSGADLITLVRILHDHDDELAKSLLHRAAAALTPGGCLLVAEPLAGTPRAMRMGNAYFGLYLWAMGSGRARTAEELSAWLRDAGLIEIEERATRIPLQTRLIVARRAR
jgi:demethylspheroidene O-methyltransferase